MAFGSVPKIPSSRHTRNTALADDIDFEIEGSEMQFVEIELDPGESAVAGAASAIFLTVIISQQAGLTWRT